MSNAHSKPVHFVAVPLPTWGHMRPLIHFAVQLLRVHPSLRITVLLSPTTSPRARGEIALPFFDSLRGSDESGSVLDRLQLLDVTPGQARNVDKIVEDEMVSAMPDYVAALFGDEGGDLHDQTNKFPGLSPSAIIYDMFNSYVPDLVADTLKKLGRPMVPLLNFAPCPAKAIIHHFHPDPQIGFMTYLEQLLERGVHNRENPAEILDSAGLGDRGIVKSLPGIPRMTDFELHPGSGLSPLPAKVMLALIPGRKALADPRTTACITVFEEDIAKDAQAGFEVFGKPFHPIGMQYPDSIWDGQPEGPVESNTDAVAAMNFLDRMHKKHGDHSVIYVSFGSAFFPVARLAVIEHILTTLLESNTPFLFAHACELLPIPEYLLKMVEGRANAHRVEMAPQISVLHHPATGAFLTHCGGNSTSEAITAGVPMIGVPFAADQGEYCALMKEWGAAHDIKQVKTFMGDPAKFPKTLYDGTKLVGTDEAIKEELTELWARLKDGYADELRQNMLRVKEICAKSRRDGTSRKEMEGLARYF